METQLSKESPIAICFLEKDKDINNQCLLTNNYLSIIRKGKVSTFNLDEIHHISFSRRKLMLPLLIGGIFGPLSVIAISKDIFNPWGILIWLMLNLLLIYYGWIGYIALTVNFREFHRDFHIKTKSSNLKAFATFANNYILKKKTKSAEIINPVFHIIDSEEWESIKGSMEYSPLSLLKEGLIHLCDKNQIPIVLSRHYKNTPNLLLLSIDPIKLKHELKYESVYDNEALYPHLYGPLNLDAIVKADVIQ